MADVPVTSWDETDPADGDDRNIGDNELVELKTQIQQIMAADHKFDTSGQGTTWGYHEKVTLLERSSNPSAVTDAIILFTKETSSKAEAYFIDEDGNNQQLTSAGNWIGGMVDEIRMWNGVLSSLPPGWGLCSGIDGKPDHYNKFVRGIDTSVTEPQANTGGSNSITLAIDNLPAHSHNISAAGSHAHTIRCGIPGSVSDGAPNYQGGSSSANESGFLGNNDGQHTHTLANSGSNSSFDNQPAYYELAYLVKL